ncbi:hypothetical protein [Echinicola sp. 20G]|uniref:hypothetical protein n=1 Tax=Echinicola sp. 20G TaxID=2781961 RepID=UPI00190FE06E|nr:hypothetical protein [Echinicola sp. 20G]
MKRQKTFTLDDNDSFFKLTSDYFFKTGFRQTSRTENQITFKKGSTLRNMVTFNLLNWKSEVRATLQNDTVMVDFDINTTGQLITPREEKLWDMFIENYKTSVTDKVDMTSENQRHLRETKRDNVSYIKWALIGAIAFGIPFGFLAYFTDIGILASIGATAGGVSFVTFKINSERKKNALKQ